MRQNKREKRQKEIEDSAYLILEEQGIAGLTMASLAKRAKASMETLYNWYGDKNGLYAALVQRNSADVLAILDHAKTGSGTPEERLRTTALALLGMLTSPKAIALNRAAIADPTATLGPLLSTFGRSVVGPRLAELMVDWRDAGCVAFDDRRAATQLFVTLLVGDHQIQRVTGAAGPLTPDAIEARVERAMDQFQRLHPA